MMLRASTVFNSSSYKYFAFDIEPTNTVLASEAKADSFSMADSSGNEFSAERILYSPETNAMTIITTDEIALSGEDTCTITYTSSKKGYTESFGVFPKMWQYIESESVGITDFCFYDSNGNPVYDVEGRSDLTFKGTLRNSTDEDILDETFYFYLNGDTNKKISEQTLSIGREESIVVEIVCDFALVSGDRVTVN